jgi:hypothetical protein
VRGFGDGENEPETPLELTGTAAEEAERFIASQQESQSRLGRVTELMEGYETPFGMELLATVTGYRRAPKTPRVRRTKPFAQFMRGAIGKRQR